MAKKTKKNTIRMMSTGKVLVSAVKSRKKRLKEKLEGKEVKLVEQSTGIFYVTKKNPNPSDPNKKKPLEIRKYDKYSRTHVIYKEAKMK